MKKRCDWCEDTFDQYVAYHDEEWGVPVHDDKKQFEFLILEGAQAGLSWSTILKKREGYRKAFAEFEVQKVARFDENKIQELLNNPEIIRNKLKVRSAVSNAQKFIEVQKEFGSFDEYIWSFVGGEPIQNSWKSMKEVPAETENSDKLAKDLKKRGFKFVGSTIMYAHMQAVGMVNDHLVSCYRHKDVQNMH
ncbi:MAG: DNA-3-methyladenine glycosylase I [Candidatus Halalkalibacterium sp. M3_1C_030]